MTFKWYIKLFYFQILNKITIVTIRKFSSKISKTVDSKNILFKIDVKFQILSIIENECDYIKKNKSVTMKIKTKAKNSLKWDLDWCQIIMMFIKKEYEES